MDAAVKVVHFADPFCWWSWGLEPVLRRLEAVYGDRLEVEYRMAGMADDVSAWMQEYGVDEASTVDWIREANELTGNPVDPEFVRKTGMRSSTPGCLAVKAAQVQDRVRAERYLRRLLEAFQIRAEPATGATLLRVARDVGLDPERLGRDMGSAEVREAFEADRRAMERAQANFLSLVIVAGGKLETKGEVFTSKPFEEMIDRLVPDLPKRMPVDILEYMEDHRDLVPAREVAEVFRIGVDDARERLAALERAGLLRRSDHAGTSFWTRGEATMDRLPFELVKVSHVPPEAHVDAATDLTPIITRAVQNLYTEVARRPEKEYHFPLGLEALRFVGYPEEDLARLPPRALESFAGVGYPFAADAIRAGDTVLDIGSGSGTDVLYAWLKAGPKGRVYGLDITPAMIEKARANIAAAGAAAVTILEGSATAIPLPDEAVDVVTSNGVLNLVPDKATAFREIARVLRPGGRLQVADIVVQADVGAVCGLNPQLWADCIGGAAVEGDYMETIAQAGFEGVRTVRRIDYFSKSRSESTKRITRTFGAQSVVVAAHKPA